MKLATLDEPEIEVFAKWVEAAKASGQPITLHVVGQGWELRCHEIRPFFFYPDPIHHR
jgi:hydroxyethylthiazole kinase-like sugar kinase family protein